MAKQLQAKFIGIRAGSDDMEGLIPGGLYEVDTSWAYYVRHRSGCLGLMGEPWVGGPVIGSNDPDSWVHLIPGKSNTGRHKMVFEVRL